MNHIYKVVFNKATGAFVAVAEFAKSQGKKSSTVNNSSADTSVSTGMVKFFNITPLTMAVLAALGLGFASNANAAGLVGSQYDKGGYSNIVIGGQADANTPAYAYDDTVSEGNKQFTTSSHNSLTIGGNSNASNTWYGSALGYGATVASPKSTQTTITQTWGTVTNPPSYTVANSSGSNRGNVALGAFSAAGDTNTGAETKSFTIGSKTYTFAGQPTDKTSVLAIGSGKEVQAVPDSTDGIRVAANNGMFNDKTTSTDEFKYRQIQYVAAGRVAEDSTDGVNGSQLYQAFKAIQDLSANVGTDKQNYFHVNATGQDKSSDPTANTTNLAAVDGIGGAKAAYSLAAGFNAQALSNNTIAIGKDAGVGFVDPQGTRQHIVNGQIQTATNTIATNYNVIIGDKAGTNSAGVNQVVIGRGAGNQYFGDDSVTIGTNANNYSEQTAADGTKIGTDKLVRGRWAVAVGQNARTWADGSIAIGRGSEVSSIKVGDQYTNADRGMALGYDAKAQGQEAIAVGYQAATSRLQSVAIGKGAKVEALTSGNPNISGSNMAIGTNALVSSASQAHNMAIGEQAKVLGNSNRSMAIGSQAITTGNNLNSAVGNGAKAHGDTTSAYGSATQVRGGFDAMAFGSRSATNGEGVNYSNQVAVGSGAITGAKSATAIGSGVMSFGKNSTAIGATGGGSEARIQQALATGKMTDTTFSIIGGTNNTAIGNANLIGSTSNNNFVFGNNIKVGATSATVAVAEEDVTAPNGTVVKYDKYTPTFNGEKTVEQAIAIGQAAAVSANNTIAIGSGATASGTQAVAIGTGSAATGEKSIAIGYGNKVSGANSGTFGDPTVNKGTASYTVGNDNAVGSTTSNAFVMGNQNAVGTDTQYENGGKLYEAGSFGTERDASGSFAIGNRNYINSKDTFVLGSGINSTGTGDDVAPLGNTVANSVYLGNDSDAMGNGAGQNNASIRHRKVDSRATGTTTTAGMSNVTEATVNGVTYSGFAGTTPVGVVTVGASGSERRIQNVAAGQIAATSTDAINGSQLYSAVEGMRWTLQENSTDKDKVRSGDVVNFVNGNATTVTITPNNATDATSSQVKFDVAVDGTTVQIKDGKLTATSKDTSASVTAGSTAVTVEKGTASTVNGVEVTDYKVDLSQGAKDSLAKADTALQSFTTSVNGTQVETINQTNKDVNFVNGKATTARASGSDITFDVNTDGTTIKVDGNKIVANTTPITVGTDGKVATPANTNALVTAGDIANAINNSGFTLKSSAVQGEGSKLSGTDEVINPGDTVEMIAGKNLVVAQAANGKITYSLSNHVVLADEGSLSIGDSYLNTEGLTAPKVNFGPAYNKSHPSISANDDGNLVVGGPDDEPIKITNLADGTDDKDAVNVSQLKGARTVVVAGKNTTVSEDENSTTFAKTYTVNAWDTKATAGSTALTVTATDAASNDTNKTRDYVIDLSQGSKDSLAKADTAVQSFTTSVNGTKAETINQDNSDVNFVNGNATTARASGSDITFDINTDGTTIKVDGNKIAANTTSMTVGDDGKVATPANTNALATAGDIANAINNSGFTLKSSAVPTEGRKLSGTDEVINPGDTVEMIAGKNLTVAQAANGKITYSLAKDVDLGDDGSLSIGDSYLTTTGLTTPKVNFGPDGSKDNPSIGRTDGGDLVVGNPTGEAVKITNVKAGEADTDAVNVSQLKQVLAASNTKVVGDKGVNVTSETNQDDGSTTYTVAAKTDGTTVKVDGNGNITAVTAPISTEGNKAKTDGANNLATAGDVVNAINNSGFTLKTSANGGKKDSGDDEVINPGDVVDMAAGKNLIVAQAANGKITYSLAKDVDLGDDGSLSIGDSYLTTTGLTTPKVNFGPDGSKDNPSIGRTDGGDLVVGNPDGEPVKITNLKAGEADTDAVNVSQLKAAQAAATTTVEGDHGVEVVASQNADGSTNYIVSAVTDGVTTTINDAGEIAAVTSDITTNTDGKSTATTPTSLVTAGDVAEAINASGWKLAADGTAGTELINPSDTVTFKAVDNLNVSRDGANITYGLNKDVDLTKDGSLTIGDTVINTNGIATGNTAMTPDGIVINGGPAITHDNQGNFKLGDINSGEPVKITNLKAGEADNDAVNVSQLKAAQAAATTKVEGDQGVTVTPETNKDGSTTYTVAAKTDGTTVKVDKNGNIAAVTSDITTNTDGVATATTPSSLVTAGDVAEAINASGWKLAAEGTAGTELINPSDTVTFKAVDNLNVSRDGANITYGLNKDVDLTKDGSLTIGDTVINTNGIATGNTAMTPDGIVINGGPAITHDNQGNFKLGNINSGEPVKITNLKAGEADTDAVNVSQLKAAQAAATTKVEGDQGVTVTPETNKDGSTTYTVAAKTDGTTVKVDDKGNIAAVTSDITTNTDGSSTATTPSSLVTAGDVAKAINKSGWNLAAEGTDGKELINPADTVTFKAKDNLNVSRDGANITYGLNKDVDLTKDGSLTIGDTVINTNGIATGNTAMTPDGIVINGGPAITHDNQGNFKLGNINSGEPVKITNLQDGTDANDAVNVSQLNKAAAASKEVVKSNDKSVTVTTTQNADGANVFDLSVNTDGTTITKNANGALTANTTPLTNHVNGTVNTPANVNALATAGDIANAINQSGFTLTAQGSNGSLVKPGATVDMNNTDGNILISKSDGDNNVTYNLAKDINVDSVTAGNTVVNNSGMTIYNANPANTVSITETGLNNGGNTITNVAPGVNDTDAVNVSQLKASNQQINGNIARLDGKINQVDRDLRGGIASAVATAGLPQAFLPGKSMVAMGAATYRGQSALAIGVSRISDNGKIIIKATGSTNTRGDVTASIGAGYQW